MPFVKALLAIFVVGLLTLVGLGAYIYFQNGKSFLAGNFPIKAIASPLASPLAQAASPTPAASPQAVGGTTVTTSAVVTFTSPDSFTPVEKAELTKKIVNPLVDYYADQQAGYLVSLTIAHNTQASSATYPYQGQAVFNNGGNSGFLITKLGTGVDWWFPECMGACPYTDTYKAKYPEVVAKTH